MMNHEMPVVITTDLNAAPRFKLKRHDARDADIARYADVALRVNAAMPPATAALIGLLSVDCELDDYAFPQPQFRSGSLPALAGAELRFHHLDDVDAPLPSDELVEWVLEHALAFHASLGKAVSNVTQARQTAIETIALDTAVYPPMALSSIGSILEGKPGRLPYGVVVKLNMLGPSLMTVSEPVYAWPCHLKVTLADKIAQHRARAELLAQFRANRQRGLIEVTTLLIMQSVGMDLDFVLEHLTRRKELVFGFGDDALEATISWSEGVLETIVSKNGSFDLRAGELRLGQAVPDTILMAMQGRRLGSVIAQAYIPDDTIITHACADRDGNAVFNVTVPTVPIPWPLRKGAVTRAD